MLNFVRQHCNSKNTANFGGLQSGQMVCVDPALACATASVCCAASTVLGMREGKSCQKSAVDAGLNTALFLPIGMACEDAFPNTQLLSSLVDSYNVAAMATCTAAYNVYNGWNHPPAPAQMR